VSEVLIVDDYLLTLIDRASHPTAGYERIRVLPEGRLNRVAPGNGNRNMGYHGLTSAANQAKFPVHQLFDIPTQVYQNVFSVPSQQVHGAVPSPRDHVTQAYGTVNTSRPRFPIRHMSNSPACEGPNAMSAAAQQYWGGFVESNASAVQFGGGVPNYGRTWSQ
jgi:hypothetical protein